MTEAINHQVRLAQRPKGDVQPSDWAHTDEPVPTIGDGQFLVRLSHISLDPAMRGWLNDAPSYIPPVGINEVMRAFAAGEVLESNHPSFAVGSHVTGVFGVQEYAVSDGSGVLAVDPSTVPIPTSLSALGVTGLTAYFGLFDVGALAEGETVLVSGAAGAVANFPETLQRACSEARTRASSSWQSRHRSRRRRSMEPYRGSRGGETAR
jgi:NADPH-dependent curcumin reductase CurA